MSPRLAETLQLKTPELERLAAHVPGADVASPRDYADFASRKAHLMRELRVHALRSNPFPNTKPGESPVDWFGLKFQQRYSRMGDPMLGPGQAASIYPGAPATLPAQGFFFSSGQAAMHSVLAALQARFGYALGRSHGGVYYESQELLERLPRKRSGKALPFYDTSATSFRWTQIPTDADAPLVLDTTCTARDDAELGEFLRALKTSRSPAILVRSCLKLDSFGVEYGNLGHALVVNPRSFPSASNRSTVRSNPLGTFLEELKTVGGAMGHFPQLDAVYPFYADPAVTALNSSRIARIRRNSRALTSFLSTLGWGRPTLPPHGLFLLVGSSRPPKKDFPRHVTAIREKTGFPIYHAESFGFDASVVTHFQEFYSGHYCLRVAPPDMAEGDLRDHAGVYVDLLRAFHGKG